MNAENKLGEQKKNVDAGSCRERMTRENESSNRETERERERERARETAAERATMCACVCV